MYAHSSAGYTKLCLPLTHTQKLLPQYKGQEAKGSYFSWAKSRPYIQTRAGGRSSSFPTKKKGHPENEPSLAERSWARFLPNAEGEAVNQRTTDKVRTSQQRLYPTVDWSDIKVRQVEEEDTGKIEKTDNTFLLGERGSFEIERFKIYMRYDILISDFGNYRTLGSFLPNSDQKSNGNDHGFHGRTGE